MSKKDTAFQELIAVARSHPELFDPMMLETGEVTRLLKTRAAREFAKGLDAAAFVRADGALQPLRMCMRGTTLCKSFTLIFAEKAA